MGKPSDIEILTIALTDKRKAFELAFSNYWQALYIQAYRKLQSEDAAKDLVQEVYMVMWENLDKLAQQDQLLPYLFAVLRNKVLKKFQKDEVRLRYAVSLTRNEESTDPSSLQLILSKELQEIISDEIGKMPSKMREIYNLKKNEQYSIKEIAEKLNISEQTVKNQLLNGANRLKLRLKGYDSSLTKIGIIISGLYSIVHH